MAGNTALRDPGEAAAVAALRAIERRRRRTRCSRADWRRGVAVCAVSATLAGLVAGWWTPHWPVTPVQALAAMALALVLGVIAGAALRSRWAMLLAPTGSFVLDGSRSPWEGVGPAAAATAAVTRVRVENARRLHPDR